MNTLFTAQFIALTVSSNRAQYQNINTKSVEIDNLISFVINTYPSDDLANKNITCLIQVKSDLNGWREFNNT